MSGHPLRLAAFAHVVQPASPEGPGRCCGPSPTESAEAVPVCSRSTAVGVDPASLRAGRRWLPGLGRFRPEMGPPRNAAVAPVATSEGQCQRQPDAPRPGRPQGVNVGTTLPAPRPGRVRSSRVIGWRDGPWTAAAARDRAEGSPSPEAGVTGLRREDRDRARLAESEAGPSWGSRSRHPRRRRASGPKMPGPKSSLSVPSSSPVAFLQPPA